MTQSTAATDELKRALAAEEGGRKWLRRLAVAGVVALALGGGLFWRAKHKPPPAARFITQTAAMGDVAEKVQATGAVQPLLQVNVGAQVNGRVTRVPVDFNSVVKKGDVLAEIDPTVYSAQVNNMVAQLAAQRAALESARAQEDTLKIQWDRLGKLYSQNLAAKGELDSAKGNYDVAHANSIAAQAQIDAIQAQLAQSQTNVAYTKIYSPVNGVVVSRAIDPGATVVASFQAPTLFVIAQDLRKMRVMADVDEADVGKLKEGMEADAAVDAFPGESFRGRVSQVRYSPNTVSGVVTYSAVVEVENPDEKLRPGMTATVTITTKTAKGALRVPNAALRYRPSPPLGADGKPVVQPPAPPLDKGKGRVFVLANDKPGEEKEEEKLIDVGITDGIFTEVKGGVVDAQKVIVDETDEDKNKKKGKAF
jgi:HlyD family secretion protein